MKFIFVSEYLKKKGFWGLLNTVASTYLAASSYSRSSSSPTTTAMARPPRIVSFSIYAAMNVLDLFTQF